MARDHYVRVASNDYSVHPANIGRLVEVVADLEQVTATFAGNQRCWAAHQTITDQVHARAAAELRRVRVSRPPAPADSEVELRSRRVGYIVSLA